MVILRKQFSTKTKEENKHGDKELKTAIGLGALGYSGNNISLKISDHLEKKRERS